MKPDDWWHFDSPDMYEMGKRFASELVLNAECPKIISIEDFSVNVSGGATLFTHSATEINLPTYAKARTESGKKLYVPIVYKDVPDYISSERLVVDVAYGDMRAEAAIIPQNDPVVDGRIDESIWASVRAYPISDKGSVIRIYQGEAGIYLSAEIVDTSIMNQWYDGNAWDPYLENDQVKFYLHTGERASGTVDEHSYAIYLTASNVLRVYRGRSDGTWDAINHYGRYEEGYYKKYQHRVRIDGTPFNATDDIDRGYSMEIFIPYECLGDDVAYIRRNLKINAAYEDKKDYEIPHTTYQLNGGMNEYDDLNIYLPYEVFCRAKKYAFDV